jgi:FAD/FMN-containing dehydrogenase
MANATNSPMVQFVKCENHGGFAIRFALEFRNATGDRFAPTWNSGTILAPSAVTSPPILDLLALAPPGFEPTAVYPVVDIIWGGARKLWGEPVDLDVGSQLTLYRVGGTLLSRHIELIPTTLSNWSRTVIFTPQDPAKPKSRDELIALLKRNDVKRVRPMGSGHSWNHAIATDSVSVDTTNIPFKTDSKTVLVNGQEVLEITVAPGMPQGEFVQLAASLGAPVPTHGPALDITMGGFVSNGCHGTGSEQPTIVELVYALELIDAQGRLLRFSADTGPTELNALGLTPTELMNVVRVSLGLLGVLVSITFRIPKSQNNVLVSHLFVPIDQVFDASQPELLAQYLRDYDYVEVFWFPYNQGDSGPDLLWLIAYKTRSVPIDENITGPALRQANQVDALGPAGKFVGAILAAGELNDLTPFFSWVATCLVRLKFKFCQEIVLRAPDAFLYQKAYFRNFLDLEFALPMTSRVDASVAVNAFLSLKSQMDVRRASNAVCRYPVNLSVHLRFIKNSQAAMSPAYQTVPDGHTCYIEYLSYSNGSLIDHYTEFSNEFWRNGTQGWKNAGGFPHWGKMIEVVPDIHSYVRSKLQQNGRLNRFEQVRKALDPTGKFINSYLDEFLHPPSTMMEDAALPQSWKVPTAAPIEGTDASREISSPRIGEVLTRSSAGALQVLIHDGDKTAALVNERGEVIRLEYATTDEGHVVYTTKSNSFFFKGDEILDRVEAMHHPDSQASTL